VASGNNDSQEFAVQKAININPDRLEVANLSRMKDRSRYEEKRQSEIDKQKFPARQDQYQSRPMKARRFIPNKWSQNKKKNQHEVDQDDPFMTRDSRALNNQDVLNNHEENIVCNLVSKFRSLYNFSVHRPVQSAISPSSRTRTRLRRRRGASGVAGVPRLMRLSDFICEGRLRDTGGGPCRVLPERKMFMMRGW